MAQRPVSVFPRMYRHIAEGQVKAPAEMFAAGESSAYSSSFSVHPWDTASKWRGH